MPRWLELVPFLISQTDEPSPEEGDQGDVKADEPEAGEPEQVTQEPKAEPEGGAEGEELITVERSYIKQLREEAKKYRLRLRETERKLKELQQQIEEMKLSEKEKMEKRLNELQARAAELENKLKGVEIEKTIILKAVQKGFKDPIDVVAYLRYKGLDSEAVENEEELDEALEALAQEKPYWLAGANPANSVGKTPGGAVASAAPKPQRPKSKAEENALTDEKKAQLEEEYRKALAAGDVIKARRIWDQAAQMVPASERVGKRRVGLFEWIPIE